LIKIFRVFIFLILFAATSFTAQAQHENYIQILGQRQHWVDSVYKRLSRREKIAQLFFVRAHTDKGLRYEDSVAEVIKSQEVGGLVFFQGGPVRQAELINRYQKISALP